ncbi:TonB-dependent receptor [Shimia sp. R11_0]|uniref:TonB-dependent receptor n=1 Tax=Shimia sp. R11_0 TaxID=2821096 RepID=UPI001ADCF4EE|nr:TonB-dependent receptor [Shimia sp. R11_0]MBO9476060.1 TonB-dependent receptor [Shimia sp. R11_0]
MTHHFSSSRAPSRFYAALLQSTAVALFLAPAPLLAQDVTFEDDETFSLGEIVVSARRVEERLDETPVPVSVVTEEEMGTGRTDRLGDLTKATPNIMVSDGDGASFVIRGVGSQSVQGLGSEVGVGLFADEVYLGSAYAAPIYLDDLERAEVVRGSQATLYGRNTIGGAINLVSREPGEVLAGEAEVSVGSDGYFRLRGGLDTPLSEDGRWLSRTFLSLTKQPDGISNLPTGEDDLGIKAFSGRFTLMGQLTERTELKFTLDGENVDDDGKSGWAPLDLALNHQSDLDYPAHRDNKRYGSMLRLDHDMDFATLTSITAVRGFDQDWALDGDFTSGPYDPANGAYELQQGQIQDQTQFTQEFRLTSNNQGDLRAGEISWNAGLFFMKEDYDGYQFYELASVPSDMTSRNILKLDGKSVAAFGNITYQASERLGLTLGGRYTYESKKGDLEVASASGTNFYGTPTSGRADVDFTNFSPELSVDYRLGNGGLLYARAASGFKSGGISQFFDANGDVNTFEPETSDTYEVGVKTPVFNEAGWLEVNLFHTDWQDQHANVFISDFQRVTANASSATSQGLEIAFRTDLSSDLSLGASYGYLDATYDDFVYTYFSSSTGSNQTVDYSGNDIPLAPKHSASLTLDWERPMANGLSLIANGSYSYRSDYSFDPVGAYRQPDSHIVDASIGVRGDNWEASLWATNLLDEEILSDYFLFGGNNFGIATPGRKFGITLKSMW